MMKWKGTEERFQRERNNIQEKEETSVGTSQVLVDVTWDPRFLHGTTQTCYSHANLVHTCGLDQYKANLSEISIGAPYTTNFNTNSRVRCFVCLLKKI